MIWIIINIKNKNILIFLSKFLLFFVDLYFLNNISIYEFIKKNKINNLKVCICTLGKEENRYIKEFVEHYKNYGVDKIYLYDNNDIDGEKFENVIQKYVDNKFVEINNWRGIKGKSTYYKIMDSCYQTYHDYYDWLIFYEIDEFIYLKKYKNIKSFLINHRFNQCESIQLNWVHMSDNNQLFYENKTLNERFTEKGKNIIKNRKNKICYVKSIIKGGLKNVVINNNHLLNKKLKACNGFGEKSQLKKIMSLKPDYEFNYIKHYYGKSVQEFIEKINRGDLLRGNKKKVINWAIKKFFYINKITTEKVEYIQKHIGKKYDLTKYIKKIKWKLLIFLIDFIYNILQVLIITQEWPINLLLFLIWINYYIV